MNDLKKCTKCKIDKNVTDFYKDVRKKDGLKCWCKTCHLEDSKKRESNYNETRRLYRLNNKEENSLKKKKYYIDNKENILKLNKNWRQTFKGRLLSYKRGAIKRNLNWDLTDEQFYNFYYKNCNYCNDLIEGVGIDRVSSNLGYTVENTVPCCYQCNIMKMDSSKEEFLKKIKKIWENIQR